MPLRRAAFRLSLFTAALSFGALSVAALVAPATVVADLPAGARAPDTAPAPHAAPTLTPDPSRCAAPCTWERTFGEAFDDRAHAAAALPSGGYVVVGATRPGNGPRHDAWAVRVDAGGREIWRTDLRDGGPQQLYGVVAAGDDGALAVGHTRAEGAGESDVWLVRFDGRGRVLWRRTLGGPGNDRARGVAATVDGGSYVVGFTASKGAGDRDGWILRLDPDGRILWDRTFGGAHGDGASAVIATPDGGAYVTGFEWAGDARGADLLVMRIDADGTPIWRRWLDSARVDVGLALAPAAAGGVVVVGSAGTPGKLVDDVWALRVREDGVLLWARRFGGANRDTPWGVVETANGDVLVAAGTWSQGAGSADAWILRLAPDGRPRWARLFGGRVWDRPTAILATSDGGMLMVGHTSSKGAGYEDAWLLRLDSEGRL